MLDAKTLETLPSVGRNVFLMAVTVPTVQSSGDTHWNRMQDQTGASALSMGGGGVRSNNYLLDGFPVTDLQNRSSTNPSGEMVEDVRVQVHTYDAEMGRTGGGVFNTTAQVGQQPVPRHRAISRRVRRRSVGPNFFNEIRDVPTNDQYWRNAGGGFGGPILRGKTFFWVAGEAYRDGQSQNRGLHVPTAAMRNGDFSGLTDAQGQRDRHLRSADDRRQRQPAAVPGQHHSRRTASTPSAATWSTRCRCPRSSPTTTTAARQLSGAGHPREQRRSRARSSSIITSTTRSR